MEEEDRQRKEEEEDRQRKEEEDRQRKEEERQRKEEEDRQRKEEEDRQREEEEDRQRNEGGKQKEGVDIKDKLKNRLSLKRKNGQQNREKTIESITELKKSKVESIMDLAKVRTPQELKETARIAVVSNRLTACSSNSARNQLCSVSGAELLRRIEGPEKLSASIICQLLRVGKGTGMAESVAEVVNTIRQQSGIKRTNTAILSSFTILTEEEVSSIDSSIRLLLAATINKKDVKALLLEEAPGTTSLQKVAATQTCVQMLQTVMRALNQHGEEFNSATHGGVNIMMAVIEWIIAMSKINSSQ